MITEGQAKYLKQLINEYSDWKAVAYNELNDGYGADRYREMRECEDTAKLKLVNYIAKLTETGK